MYLQKVICRKTFFKLVFVGVLNSNDENSRIRIRIRVHTKMSSLEVRKKDLTTAL
jgi:hypothetical protein